MAPSSIRRELWSPASTLGRHCVAAAIVLIVGACGGSDAGSSTGTTRIGGGDPTPYDTCTAPPDVQPTVTCPAFDPASVPDPLVNAIPTPTVGSAPGAFAVADDGAATYTIPLYAPPGRAGMTPDVAIHYSSNGGDGLMGVGSAIQGLSSIERCQKTNADNGTNQAVTYDVFDRMCLDGVPLVKVGDEYRTLPDTFSRIVAFPASDQPPNHGPAKIVVFQKDTRIFTYLPTLVANGVVVSWGLTQIIDRSGNTIDYQYVANDGPTQRWPQLATIRYTGHVSGSPAPRFSLSFHYGAREHPRTSYIHGAKVRLDQILTNVTLNDGSADRHVYLIEYVQDGSGRPRISAVKDCAYDAQNALPICRPSTRFTSVAEKPGFIESASAQIIASVPVASYQGAVPGDFDGDGRSDLLYHTNEAWHAVLSRGSPFAPFASQSYVVPGTGGYVWRRLVLDYDGNGTEDVLFIPGTAGNYAVAKYAAGAFTLQDTGVPAAPVNDLSNTKAPNHWVLDLNGDGLKDLVECDRYRPDGQHWQYRLNTGSGFDGVSHGIDPLNNADVSGFPDMTLNPCIENVAVIDFDGDGSSELLVRETFVWKIHADNGSFIDWHDLALVSYRNGGFTARGVGGTVTNFDPTAYPAYCNDSLRTVLARKSRIGLVADLNGDGLPDLLSPQPDRSVRVFRNDGISFKDAGLAPAPMDQANALSTAVVLDFNSDGRDDILVPPNSVVEVDPPPGEECGPPPPPPHCANDAPRCRCEIVAASGEPCPSKLACVGAGGVESCTCCICPSSGSTFACQGTPCSMNGDNIVVFDEGDCHATESAKILTFAPTWPILLGGDITTGSDGQGNVFDTFDLAKIDSGLGGSLPPTIFDSDGARLVAPRVLDANGDGKPDLVVSLVDSQAVQLLFLPSQNTFDAPYGAPLDRVVAIADGNASGPGQVSVLLRYTPLIYTPWDGVIGRTYTRGDGCAGGLSACEVSAQRYVISEEFRDTGATVGPGVDPLTQFVHTYFDARLDRGTRASLGFGKHAIYGPVTSLGATVRTRTYDVTTYDADVHRFPFAGVLASETVKTPTAQGAVTIAEARQQTVRPTYGGNTFFVFVDTSVTTTSELTSGIASTHTITSGQVDDFGNVAVTTDDVDGTPITSTRTYLPADTNAWLVGRMQTLAAQNGSKEQHTTYAFDSVGRLESVVTEPGDQVLELTRTFERDAHGNITRTKSVDGGGNMRETCTGYTADGYWPYSRASALGHVALEWHDGLGETVATKDPNGRLTRIARDLFERATTKVDPDGSVTASQLYALDPSLRGAFATLTVTSEGAAVATIVDRVGRELARWHIGVGDELIVDGTTTYDLLGRATTIGRPYKVGAVGAGGPPVDIATYDDLGRMTHRLASDGTTESWSYTGLHSTYTNPRMFQTRTTTDGRGQPLNVHLDGDGAGTPPSSTSYVWDGTVGLSSSNANGVGTTYALDAYGRVLSLSDPDAGTNTYQYNAFGEAVARTGGAGKLTTSTYDRAGRVILRKAPEGCSSWVYDPPGALGALATSAGPSGVVDVYAYNAQVQIVSHTRTIPATGVFETQYHYDAQGRLAQMDYPKGPTPLQRFSAYFGYSRGVLTGLSANMGAGVQPVWGLYRQSAGGDAELEGFGNGLLSGRVHDPVYGRLTDLLTGTQAALVQYLHYDYDPNGNVIARRDHLQETLTAVGDVIEHFEYDAFDRVVKGGLNLAKPQYVYAYDHNGNLVTKTGAKAIVMSTTRPHLLAYVGQGPPEAYQYDADGNLSKRGKDKFTHTSMHQLASATIKNQTTTFAYDASGDRALKSSSTGATAYMDGLYERVHVSSKVNDGLLHRYYLRAAGRLIAVVEDKDSTGVGGHQRVIEYVHPDNLGSPDLVTSATGTVLDRQSFDPFGSRRNPDWSNTGSAPTPTSKTGVGFTGYDDDLGGLLDAHARGYDPTTGRFIAPDAIRRSGAVSNRYSYADNNPLTLVDRRGYAPQGAPGFPPSGGTSVTYWWNNAGGGDAGPGDFDPLGSAFSTPTIPVTLPAPVSEPAETGRSDDAPHGSVPYGARVPALTGGVGRAGPTTPDDYILQFYRGTSPVVSGGQFPTPAIAAYNALRIYGPWSSWAQLGDLRTSYLRSNGLIPKVNFEPVEGTVEVGGLIYRLPNGLFGATPPVIGTDTSVKVFDAQPLVPEGATVVGDWHTHTPRSGEGTHKVYQTLHGAIDFSVVPFTYAPDSASPGDVAYNSFRAVQWGPQASYGLIPGVYHFIGLASGVFLEASSQYMPGLPARGYSAVEFKSAATLPEIGTWRPLSAESRSSACCCSETPALVGRILMRRPGLWVSVRFRPPSGRAQLSR